MTTLNQTITHRLQLAVTHAELQTAIDDALVTQATVAGVHVLQTRGSYHDELCTLITAALTSHLSVGE